MRTGAGKATMVEILEGFRRPSAGQVRVLGASPLTADRRWRARTGIAEQSWRDHGRWRVREFHDLLAGIRRELGTTVLMTTHYHRCTPDSTSFVRHLFAAGGEDISELEGRRASLEDTYLALVRQAEASPPAVAGRREEAA